MFWKSISYINSLIYLFDKTLSKTQSINLALVLEAHFIEWRFMAFWKRALHILHMNEFSAWHKRYFPWTYHCLWQAGRLYPSILLPGAGSVWYISVCGSWIRGEQFVTTTLAPPALWPERAERRPRHAAPHRDNAGVTRLQATALHI